MERSVECVYVHNHTNTVECNGTIYHSEEILTASTGEFWLYLILYIVLVLFAGLMSGLTMGLLSLDVMSLEVLKRGGKPRQKKYAARILWIVRRHHLLLVTLLLANAVAVETMPIFLNKITHEIIAIIVSVTAVLLFGENRMVKFHHRSAFRLGDMAHKRLTAAGFRFWRKRLGYSTCIAMHDAALIHPCRIIPQALCTRFGLAIGYYCSPVVLLLMALFYPIAFPIAMLLDCLLGKEHGTFFRRAELRELVKMHGDKEEGSNEEPLSYDEVLIIKSALEMRDKTVVDAMTPLESVYMLDLDGVIDRQAMQELLHRGHSRVPVCDGSKERIVGMLLVKKLIQLDPDDCTAIASLPGSQIPPPSCLTTKPLYDLLNLFQTGRSHLYLVYEEEKELSEPELKGIITLEDVIEELIGEEIVDETDLYVDVHRRIAVARARLSIVQQSISAPAGSVTRATRRPARRSHSQPHVRPPPSLLSRQASRDPNTLHVPEQHVISTSVPERTHAFPNELETIDERESINADEFAIDSDKTPLLQELA